MIPNKLHFVWIATDLPDWAAANIDAFRELNPGYEIKVHGEEVLKPSWRTVYDSLPCLEAKSDLLRYSILMKEGGWYFDCDFWPLRPLDDLIRAYRLNGQKVFLTEQHFQQDPVWTVANGIIGTKAGHPFWDSVSAFVQQISVPMTRVTFGPAMLTQLLWDHRDDGWFRIGRWPWFYPIEKGPATNAYLELVRGDDPVSVFHKTMPATAGQLPYVLHLWQHGSVDLGQKRPRNPQKKSAVVIPQMHGKRIGLLANNQAWNDGTQPFRSVYDGFMRLGAKVDVCAPANKWPLFSGSPAVDCVVMWNGAKSLYTGIVKHCQDRSIPVIIMEHGFYQRRHHTQLDPRGFAHRASWAASLEEAAPQDGAARFRRVWGSPPTPVRKRKGYMLVLCQMPGDAQLDGAEIDTPGELVRAVEAACPPGIDIRVRSHPRMDWSCGTQGRARMLAGTLKEAVDGAAFALTINSNSGNEALAWGCPVLCFGPALYAMVGVAQRTTLATLAQGIGIMADGWVPANSDVENYLYHLACRQWSRAELSEGRILGERFAEAMG